MNMLILALACAHTPEAPVADLSQLPAVAPVPDFTPPIPTEHALQNGIKVWVVERPGIPLVSARVVIPGGSASDPDEAWGLSSLTDEMLEQGSGSLGATEFAREVERLALSLSAHTTGTATIVSLDAQVKTLDAGLDLMADMILRPALNGDDLKRVRDIRIGQLTESSDDATTVASWTVEHQYFGAGHPLAHPTEGTLSTIKAITDDQIQASWERRFVPDHAHIVVSGDVNTEATIAALNARFGEWKTTDSARTTIPAPAVHEGEGRYFFVHKPGTSQTALQIMMPAPTGSEAGAEPAELGAIVLGGTFTSRLNRKLREEKGYTYGARARYNGVPTYGTLLARTNVQNEVAAPALQDLLDLLAEYRNGIDDVELGKAKGAWQTRSVSSMESRSSIASSFAGLTAYGLPADTFSNELKLAKAATTATVNEAIQASSLDNAIVVVVGDMDAVQASIEEAIATDWTVLEPVQ